MKRNKLSVPAGGTPAVCRILLLLLVACSVVSQLPQSIAARPQFRIELLKQNNGVPYFDRPIRITETGMIMFNGGYIWESGVTTLYAPTSIPPLTFVGGPKDLSNTGWMCGQGSYTNRQGATVVGYRYNIFNGASQIFPGLRVKDTLPYAAAFGINDAGMPVGESEKDDAPAYVFGTPVIWGLDGKPIDIGPVPGMGPQGGLGFGYRITGGGYCCGTIGWPSNESRGWAFIDGAMYVIEATDGEGGKTSAADINDAGDVVGIMEMDRSSTMERAYLRRNGGATTLLFAPPGPAAQESRATGINNQGWVIGNYVGNTSTPQGVFLYDGDSLYNLNSLIIQGGPSGISEALAINDFGVIAGVSGNQACRLIPIPPPGSLIVNSVRDLPDLDPGDSICNTGGFTANGLAECTMRAALEEANALAGEDTITFAVETAVPPSISLTLGELPEITERLFIDGRTQFNGNPLISGIEGLFDTISFPIWNGLTIDADGVTIRNLDLVSFSGAGILIQSGDSARIFGCRIGTNRDNQRLGNGYGIQAQTREAQIGTEVASDGNTIMYNRMAGIVIESGQGNTVRGNRIDLNDGLGIDILPAGVTPNDTLDSDDGPNGLTNYPVIDSVNSSGSNHEIFGHLNAEPNESYIVDCYRVDSCDAGGYGEGTEYLGGLLVFCDQQGNAAFRYSFIDGDLENGMGITATASDDVLGSSEFSKCFELGPKQIVLLDANQNPIRNRRVSLSKVLSSGPIPEYEFIDSVLTDSLTGPGEIDLERFYESGQLAPGDMVMCRLVVDRAASSTYDSPEPSYRTIDNGVFDDQTFDLRYDQLDGQQKQPIVLGHGELHFNVAIRIPWTAGDETVEGLTVACRSLANLVYDLGDGQLVIDTIRIWSDNPFNGLNSVNIDPATTASLEGRLNSANAPNSPVRWFGRRRGETHIQRANRFVLEDPLQLSDPVNIAGLTYAVLWKKIGLLPELPQSEQNCFALPVISFMDFRRESNTGEPASSELSNSAVYAIITGNAECEGTQRLFRLQSHWEWLEEVYERTLSGLQFPITTPQERELVANRRHFFGPNNTLSQPNVDIGSLLTVVHPSGQQRGTDKVVSIAPNVLILPGQEVAQLYAPGSGLPYRTRFELGVVSGTRQIRVWDAEPGEQLLIWGQAVDIPLSQRFETAIRDYTWSWSVLELDDLGADSVSGVSRQVVGEYAFIPTGQANDDSLRLRLLTTATLSDSTIAFVASDTTSDVSAAFEFTADGYETIIPLQGLTEGTMMVQTADDSGQYFPVPIHFTVTAQLAGTLPAAASADGYFELFALDTLEQDQTVTILETIYPPLPNGLLPVNELLSPVYAVQSGGTGQLSGSQTVSITFFPDSAPARTRASGGATGVSIGFFDEGTSIWQMLPSQYDSAAGRITASGSGRGVYAVFTTDVSTDVDEPEVQLPTSFALHQNYPNPFNPSTTIAFDLPMAGMVTMEILNLLGQQVRVLIDSRLPAGEHQVVWNGDDQSGEQVASGVYFYRLTSEGKQFSRTMVLLK